MIRCPECNSKITGYLHAGAKEPSVLYNAKRTDDETNVDYVQEISTEFLTHKLTPAKEFVDCMTPYIRSPIYDFPNITCYLQFIEEYPNEAEVIHDLYVAKSNSYLKEKLRDESNCYISACKQAIKKYRLNSQVDLLMAGHQYIMSMLLGSGIDHSIVMIMKDLSEMRRTHTDQIIEFSKLLDNKGYYARLNTKFPELVGIYNKNYLALVAPLMISDTSTVDMDEFGLSSVNYEDLLELYRKCYEFIGEFILYIIGLNNIYERGDFNEFKNGVSDIEQKVHQEDKYNRIQSFVKSREKFSVGYCDTLNKIIRNAEAHFDVQYDIFTQKITFLNQGKKTTDTEEMYLLRFAKETIKVFELAVRLWEIAYQLQKNRMICDLKQEWYYGRA